MNEFLSTLFGLCCVIGLIIAFKYATKIRHVSIDEYAEEPGEYDYEAYIGEALELMHNRNKKLIEKWCKSSGVTSPIGYYNDLNGVMTIYTTHPGWLIGKGGEKVDEFTNELEKEFNMKYTVKFVEIRGNFVNIL